MPSGPEIRWSSSWTISSGGGDVGAAVEQRCGLVSPRNRRELVGRRDDQRRSVAVDVLVHDVDGQAVLGTRRTRRGSGSASAAGLSRSQYCQGPSARAAPRARVQLDGVRLLDRLARCGVGRWPRAPRRACSVSRPCRPRGRSRSASRRVARRLARICSQHADQQGRAIELLDREQPQRVAHQHRDAVAGLVAEPPEEDGERDEPEVGLRLAAARREPEEVGDLAVLVTRVDDPAQAQEDERELERSPLVRTLHVGLGRRLSRRAASPRAHAGSTSRGSRAGTRPTRPGRRARGSRRGCDRASRGKARDVRSAISRRSGGSRDAADSFSAIHEPYSSKSSCSSRTSSSLGASASRLNDSTSERISGLLSASRKSVVRDESRLDPDGVVGAGLGIPVDRAPVSRGERPCVAIQQPVGAQIGVVDLDRSADVSLDEDGHAVRRLGDKRRLEESVAVSLARFRGPRVDERQRHGDGACLVGAVGSERTAPSLRRARSCGPASVRRHAGAPARSPAGGASIACPPRSPRGRTARRKR